ncbi:conserved hypothetical protein [Microbacterium sp. 8M]|uniref:hypothetical protein n=1 Tax=Microbacterium sp. 8M TaxID=2653153 RepID=UPI0012F13C1C|nr:hypothetical protein [Microbacterium sp. 8M]VXB05552.1 conserved hypothetical protein [Microbacterium sp. 8M]
MTTQPPAGAPSPAYAPAAASVPGKTLGIVALVLTFVVSSVLGLILGYVARSQSRAVGYDNVPAKIAIIAGWILTALGVLAAVLVIVFTVVAASQGAVSGS